MARRRTLASLLILSMVGLAACSSDDGADGEANDADPAQGEDIVDVDPPEGPAAEIAGPLTSDGGISLASVSPGPDLDEVGWVEEEFTAAGTATSYRSPGELPTDGTYELEEDASADYRTRIVVRRPGDAADFNGTVVVEWLNVSGGLDASPDYGYTAEELVRGGYA